MAGKKSNRGIWGIIAVLIIIAVVVINLPDDFSLPEFRTPTGNIIAAEGDIVVNGEIITASEIDDAYERLPEDTQFLVTRDDIIDTLINQKLLLQDAAEKGIETTDEEVDIYITQAREYGRLSVEEFELQVSEQGYTMEEFQQNIKDLLTVTKLLDQELDLGNVRVTTDKIDQYIEDNPEVAELFTGDEILDDLYRIRISGQLVQEKQLELANNYIDQLKEDATIIY